MQLLYSFRHPNFHIACSHLPEFALLLHTSVRTRFCTNFGRIRGSTVGVVLVPSFCRKHACSMYCRTVLCYAALQCTWLRCEVMGRWHPLPIIWVLLVPLLCCSSQFGFARYFTMEAAYVLVMCAREPEGLSVSQPGEPESFLRLFRSVSGWSFRASRFPEFG